MNLRRVGIVGGSSLAVVAALTIALLPYRPVVVVRAEASGVVAVQPRPVSGLRLHIFNTGTNRMSPLLVGANPPWRPVPAFVIEHPRAGLIVFDCGLSPEVAREGERALPIPLRWLMESLGNVERTLHAQMRAAGLSLEQVAFVVISHLHEDHTGTARFFPTAQFIGGPGVSGHELPGGFAARWRELDFANEGSAWPPFDAAIDLLGDGSVLLLPGGGHAREDVMAWVSLASGPVLLTGDAVVHFDWLASDDVQRIPVDPARAAVVRNQIRALMRALPTALILPGHDLSSAQPVRGGVVLHHPEWFSQSAWLTR